MSIRRKAFKVPVREEEQKTARQKATAGIKFSNPEREVLNHQDDYCNKKKKTLIFQTEGWAFA